MSMMNQVSLKKEYQEQNKKREKVRDLSQRKIFVVTQRNLPKESIKITQRFCSSSAKAPNNSYLVKVTSEKYKQYSKHNLKTWTSEIKSSYYTKPSNSLNLESKQVLSDFLNLFKLFEYFEQNNTPYINTLARNLNYVIIDQGVELKICSFTKRYSVSEHLTL